VKTLVADHKRERSRHGDVTLERIGLAEEWKASLLNAKKEHHVYTWALLLLRE
jgi:hypothetical protein